MDSKTLSTSLALFAVTAVLMVGLVKAAKKEKSSSSKPELAKPAPLTTKVFPTKDKVSKALCEYVAAAANKAIAERGVFHLAVAGGSLLDALAGLNDQKVDYSKVVLSFVNHKCVALDDEKKATIAKCKTKFANEAGITRFVCPNPSPVEGTDGSADAAFYANALKEANIPTSSNGCPIFDLVLLGLGSDGHVGSNHPMGPAVLNTTNAVAGSPKEGEPSSITLTIESINAARDVAVVVCGGSKGKKEAVKRAMVRPAEEPRGTFPAQLLQSPTYFLDSEAASDL
ncbi:Probable 6-phosphogluconolactonase 3, chloroplastic [Seminavis robusta]|uniref:Probable 6-phosphogluconolactonase 3, chloroplastic n=1 Tax=Seminavis robusta TaxID=568900 RepID=A0A9N8E1C7_9STRA|nr:Probable 6-phosphogluconolactonase 3, chloroplastic [Seminavis robusta]|eukprot:Sro436_g142470.1 Probable 6-phosphogluconolactonase 3, chloroplastic (285) ;mRNA; f:237-1091